MCFPLECSGSNTSFSCRFPQCNFCFNICFYSTWSCSFFSGTFRSHYHVVDSSMSMISLVLGARADGSTIVLARPHGTPARVGSNLFREIFFRGPRTLRTGIFVFLGSLDWHRLQSSCARLFLWFSFQSVSAVASPRVQQIADHESPVASSSEP